MLNNELDNIVKMDIQIEQPLEADREYNNILLVVPNPGTDENNTTDTNVYEIKSEKDLIALGYTENESAYIAAQIAFKQTPGPSRLYIIKRLLIPREDSGFDIQTINTVLSTADKQVSYYGVHLTSFKTDSDIQNAAKYCEENGKLFGYEFVENNNLDKEYKRTFGLYCGKAKGYQSESQPAANEYAALALMAKCFGYEPGSETWAYKTLNDIVPSVMTTEEATAVKNKYHANIYTNCGGKDITTPGCTTNGEYIDIIRFVDWLGGEMQKNVFNVLSANAKVPFTDEGIGLIQGAMEATLLNAQAIGGIAQDEFVENNKIPGFKVTVPKASDFTKTQKSIRKLKGCKFTATLVGAIHTTELQGYLTF